MHNIIDNSGHNVDILSLTWQVWSLPPWPRRFRLTVQSQKRCVRLFYHRLSSVRPLKEKFKLNNINLSSTHTHFRDRKTQTQFTSSFNLCEIIWKKKTIVHFIITYMRQQINKETNCTDVCRELEVLSLHVDQQNKTLNKLCLGGSFRYNSLFSISRKLLSFGVFQSWGVWFEPGMGWRTLGELLCPSGPDNILERSFQVSRSEADAGGRQEPAESLW